MHSFRALTCYIKQYPVTKCAQTAHVMYRRHHNPPGSILICNRSIPVLRKTEKKSWVSLFCARRVYINNKNKNVYRDQQPIICTPASFTRADVSNPFQVLIIWTEKPNGEFKTARENREMDKNEIKSYPIVHDSKVFPILFFCLSFAPQLWIQVLHLSSTLFHLAWLIVMATTLCRICKPILNSQNTYRIGHNGLYLWDGYNVHRRMFCAHCAINSRSRSLVGNSK